MAGIEEGSWPGTELIITFVIEDIHVPSQKTSKEKANSESSTSINQVSHRSKNSKIHDLL